MAESTIKITAKTEQAESALSSLGEKLKETDERFIGLGEAMGTLTSAAIAGGLVELMKSALETADQMGKMAQRAGVSVESLSQMSVAARLSDVDTQSLASAMGKLSNNMAQAQSGTNAQSRAFEQLGISVTDAHGNLKNADQVMAEVAEKFHDTSDGAGKTAAAMAIFGKAGAELIPMLNGGSEELDKFGKLSDQLGLTLDQNTAQAAQDVNDRFQIMGLAAQGIGQTVLRDMLPTFTSLSEVMVDGATNTNLLQGAADTLSVALKGIVSIGMGAVFAFKEIGSAMGGLAAAGVQLAHGDLKGAADTLGQIKDNFNKDAAEMAATEDKLWADHATRQEAMKADAANKPQLNFDPNAKDEAQKVLDAAKKQDEQLLAAHEDAFIKQIEAWKKTEDQLTALGAAGVEARKVHEQAYSVFVDAEAQKRNDDAKKHLDAQYAQENQYFGQMQARADLLGKNATQREDLRYRQEILDFQKRYAAAQQDHALSQQEEEGFQTALDNIKANHEATRMRAENSVANFSMLIRHGDYQDAMTMAQAMTAGLAQHSRAAFEVNKAASLASATVKGYETIMNAYADGSKWGGVWGAVAEAAVASVLVLTQLSQINSTQFGGGSSVSAGGAGIPSLSTTPGTPVNVQPSPAAATAQTQAQAPAQNVNITLSGSDFYSASQIRDVLIPALNNAIGDGVNLNVSMK